MITYIEMHNNRFIDERDRSFKFLNSDIESKILSKLWIRLTYVVFVILTFFTIFNLDFVYIQIGFAQISFFYFFACYRMINYPLKKYATTMEFQFENRRKMAHYPMFFIGSLLCLFLLYNLVLQPNLISYSSKHVAIAFDKSILEPKDQVQKDNLMWYFCSSRDYVFVN